MTTKFIEKLYRRVFCRHGLFYLDENVYITRKHAQSAYICISSAGQIVLAFPHNLSSISITPRHEPQETLKHYVKFLNQIATYEV